MSRENAVGAPDGTYDVFPAQANTEAVSRLEGWLHLERIVREAMGRHGYQEVRPPLFEHTSLFHKATGEVTDIVEKEMFTVPRKGDASGADSLTFRPEVTPGAVRLLVENDLFKAKNFWKVWYFGAAFRYERPQKGRYRQFAQIGVEAVGSSDPLLDVETMAVYAEILKRAGITQFDLRLNSMGDAACRPAYREALREFIRPTLEKRCENCRRRFERNVFRVLDCKVPGCVALNANAPSTVEHLCAGCRQDFERVQAGLKAVGIPFRVDPRIVRGLDYYTKTVYEFSSSALGAQDALGGGGRYDTLVGSMGGPQVGAVGFAAGVERLLIAMDAAKAAVPAAPAPDFYAVALDEAARAEAFLAAHRLRAAGLSGDLDYEGRSAKAQMRSANRTGARWAVLIGAEERAAGKVKIKRMDGGEERVVSLDEASALLRGGSA